MSEETENEIRGLLESLAQPSCEPQCLERRRLADAYADATIAWLEVSRGLRFTLFAPFRETYSVKHPDEFERTRAGVETARIKAARAQIDLKLHTSEHGC